MYSHEHWLRIWLIEFGWFVVDWLPIFDYDYLWLAMIDLVMWLCDCVCVWLLNWWMCVGLSHTGIHMDFLKKIISFILVLNKAFYKTILSINFQTHFTKTFLNIKTYDYSPTTFVVDTWFSYMFQVMETSRNEERISSILDIIII